MRRISMLCAAAGLAAAAFVAASSAAGRPFFLYMAYSHLHTPLVYDIARYGGTIINSSSSSASLEAGRRRS